MLVVPVSIADLSSDNKKLKALQQQIQAKRQLVEKQLQKKSSLQNKLKVSELKVAEISLALTDTNRQLKKVNSKLSQLKAEQKTLLNKKSNQQKVLADMVKTAYLNGKHDYTKLLLNQDDPAQLERLIVYYRNLNDARVKQLGDIRKVLSRLTDVAEELNSNKQQLSSLQKQQEVNKKELVASQIERKRAVNKLNATIKTEQQKLARLQQDQQALEVAIESAKQNVNKTPESLAGLYNLKKKLKWPARGRRIHRFGQRRSGALRWKGVVIDGRLGEPVNAIADGVVILAEWKKGFGWITVLDHGKGYLSVYGHNQALLKNVNDYVQQNEPIALVGQSGGQTSANLYFEIRYKGQTVDPARWCL